MHLKSAKLLHATADGPFEADGNMVGDLTTARFRASTCEDVRFEVITYGDTHLVDDDNDPQTPDVSETTYPTGAWTLEGSEDRQVELDIARSTDAAKWVQIPLSGDVSVYKGVDSSGSALSGITVNANDVTLSGAGVAHFIIKMKQPPSYLRLRWTDNGTVAGTADVLVSGRGA
jgi:hypothetical protein